ncbi:hypothetical protein [Chryseobacterium piscicola]|uniref:hypothetical protein n=1 Tax=Chryseobacterium piscicola TaxID=551459 RepID=UPI0013563C0C|nr:hypothetical protein [Chryseobacterium piscicola]
MSREPAVRCIFCSSFLITKGCRYHRGYKEDLFLKHDPVNKPFLVLPTKHFLSNLGAAVYRRIHIL